MDEFSYAVSPRFGAEYTGVQRAAFADAVRLFSAGELEQAAEQCRRILAAVPGHAPALHMLGLVLAVRGQLAQGLDCVEQALRIESGQPTIHAARGRILFFLAQYESAAAALESSLALDPVNADALHCLALCLHRLGRLRDAEAVARKALLLTPLVPDLLDNLGVILLERGDRDGARNCFEQALAQFATHPGALANLALLHEQDNRVDEAEQLVRAGLADQPDAVTLRLVRGRCLRRRSQFAAARDSLETLRSTGTPALRKDVEYELALCADALGDADAAYRHASNANSLVRVAYPQVSGEIRVFPELIARLQRQFTPEWVASWAPRQQVLNDRPPAFLVGFPRSGTTLLDTMLGGHPQLTVLEEQPTLQAMLDYLTRYVGDYPGALATMTSSEQQAMIRAYRNVVTVGEGESGCLLDKSPFNTVHIGLIERIFPGAPILFSTRHPCDVVWSCFMTNFAANSGTVHFTELASTVSLYCSVMSLWKTYAETLPLNCRLVRYEDLIAGPEAELRDVIAFLGLPWSSSVLEHVRHAAQRDDVRTASYAQIGRDLYYDARDRWQRYRKYLEPHLQALQPYCELFGYDI